MKEQIEAQDIGMERLNQKEDKQKMSGFVDSINNITRKRDWRDS